MLIKTNQEWIMEEVYLERRRQDSKWGANRPISTTPYLAILMEEIGEAATDTFAGTLDTLRAELIQVAAVAIAWIEAIDQEQS